MSEDASPKKTISVNGGLGLLQMVSERDTGRCAIVEVELGRGCANKDAGSQTGWGLGGSTSIREGNECERGYWPREL